MTNYYSTQFKLKSKLLLVIILSIFSRHIKAQHISDANFAAAISQNCPSCIDGSNNLTASAASLATLSISGKSISNLSGIQGFTSLTTLDCSNNSITTATLGSLPTSLTGLNVSFNSGITSLPSFSSYTSLQFLFCTNCSLTGLPNMPNSLQRLDCYSNQITALPNLSNTQITLLICLSNSIGSIPAGFLPSTIQTVEIQNNLLNSIGSLPASLTKLNIEGNTTLTSLPTLPNGLLNIYLDPTHITSLPNCPPNLYIHNQNNGDARINLPPCNYSLPLNWLSFQTKVIDGTNKKVELVWLTASEINVKQFIVERSSDGKSFETLSEPIPAFNTLKQNNYQFTDNQPLKGISYYRVKEVDFDGDNSFSWVRAINNSDSKSDFNIFPNPTNEGLNIDLKSLAGKEVTITVSDLAGKILQAEKTEVTTAPHVLDVSSLSNGMYLVRVQSKENELIPKKLQIIK